MIPKDYKPVKPTKEKVLEYEKKKMDDLSESLKTRMLEGKISEETYQELKKDLANRKRRITKELKEVQKEGGFGREYHKSTALDKKSYSALPVDLKRGERISGHISSDGNFFFYITDREHIKKFEKKKDRYYMEFYDEGKSSADFTHDFSFDCDKDGEYLLMFLNPTKKKVNVKVDYLIDMSPK